MLAITLLAAIAAPATSAPMSTADRADGRCIVVLGYAGAHGSPEQAETSRRMIPYFIGRLNGRDGRPDIAGIVTRSADQAKAAGLNAQAEGKRCEAEFLAGTSGLVAVRAAPSAPAAAPQP